MVNSPQNPRQELDLTAFSASSGEPVEWRISDAPVPYPEAVAEMEARVAAIAAGEAPELVWLLEHPPLYTSGTSGKESDLLEARFPTFATGRGGQLTYHGPGQRVAYVMLDLKRRRPDVRAYVASLEELILRRSPRSTSVASGARTGSASGSSGPIRDPSTRTRSRRSASG